MEPTIRHYEDDELAAMLEAPRSQPDVHLESCTDCAGRLEVLQLIAEALHDGSVWDDRELAADPDPSTIATLRAFADDMAAEDAYAEEVLADLLAGGRDTWMRRLHAHPEWYSAGVVRKLIEAASRAIDTMPPDAVEMTALATEIASRLDRTEYSADTIARLNGAAWRERAYALYYTGSFKGAEVAIFTSKRHFSECVVSEYDLARLRIVESVVARPLEQPVIAAAAASSAARTFEVFGDRARFNASRSAEAAVHASNGDHRRALAIWAAIDESMAGETLSDARARIVANIAHCYRELGDVARAIAESDLASSMFEQLGAPTEVARLRWNSGRLLRAGSRYAEAVQRFFDVTETFKRLGMTSESTLAALDAAELLLAQGDVARVEQVCKTVLQDLQHSGLHWTSRAMTAVSYLKEAVAARKATVALVGEVRAFVRRAPHEPQLLFAPPPLNL